MLEGVNASEQTTPQEGTTRSAPAVCDDSQGERHELRVEATGNKITCYYDGDKKIEATDTH